MHVCLREVLGEEVTWVFLSQHLRKDYLSGTDLLLYPEVLRAEMSEFACSPSASNADSSDGTAEEHDLDIYPEVLGKVLEAEGMGGTSGDAGKFGLSRGQGNGRPGARPMLDAMTIEQDAPT